MIREIEISNLDDLTQLITEQEYEAEKERTFEIKVKDSRDRGDAR